MECFIRQTGRMCRTLHILSSIRQSVTWLYSTTDLVHRFALDSWVDRAFHLVIASVITDQLIMLNYCEGKVAHVKTFCNHGWYRTVVPAVVKVNSQSNGKGQINFDPLALLTLERISMKWNLEYITTSWVWSHMSIHVALRQRGWSGRTRDMSPVLVS